MRKLYREEARHFLGACQGLDGPHRFCGEAGVLDFIRQAGCIQYDPIDVCGRNADLVLQSRVAGYTKPMLEKLLYQDRLLFDYWDKNMAILSTEDWPAFARTRQGYCRASLRSHEAVERCIPQVLAALRERGPCFSGDLAMKEKVDWYWSDTTQARAALEALYFRGVLCIHHKRGTQKCYDLAQRCLPQAVLDAPDPHATQADYLAWRLYRRIGAVGLLWPRASDAYLGIEGLDASLRRSLFQRLEKDGLILPVAIEGIRESFYLRAQDAKWLEAAPQGERTELIAPLDSLLWDRRLIRAIFGFQYKWEIYTPAAQRQYGYYVLPVWQQGDFTARIEILCRREAGVLEVCGLWPEKGKALDRRALRRRLKTFAAFHGMAQVSWPK